MSQGLALTVLVRTGSGPITGIADITIAMDTVFQQDIGASITDKRSAGKSEIVTGNAAKLPAIAQLGELNVSIAADGLAIGVLIVGMPRMAAAIIGGGSLVIEMTDALLVPLIGAWIGIYAYFITVSVAVLIWILFTVTALEEGTAGDVDLALIAEEGTFIEVEIGTLLSAEIGQIALFITFLDAVAAKRIEYIRGCIRFYCFGRSVGVSLIEVKLISIHTRVGYRIRILLQVHVLVYLEVRRRISVGSILCVFVGVFDIKYQRITGLKTILGVVPGWV